MYKTLGIAVISLATLAFMSGSRSADASPTTAISAPIVAKGKVLNQTAPIPTTTIFTPTQTGLYRLSVYGTMITSIQNSNTSGHTIQFGLMIQAFCPTQAVSSFRMTAAKDHSSGAM